MAAAKNEAIDVVAWLMGTSDNAWQDDFMYWRVKIQVTGKGASTVYEVLHEYPMESVRPLHLQVRASEITCGRSKTGGGGGRGRGGGRIRVKKDSIAVNVL
jgi:hypothetical protein